LVNAGIRLLDPLLGTGVLAVIVGARPGPTVVLRADIDALPVTEATGLAFASSSVGVMHACGHDAHAAVLLEVAHRLAARRDELAGIVLLVFQPGEELAGGARLLVQAGLFDPERLRSWGCEAPVAVLGLHVTSLAPVGVVGAAPGIAMAGADVLEIRVRGDGGHGALTAAGALVAAATVSIRLPEAVSGLGLGDVSAVCAPGSLTAGHSANVIPDEGTVLASLRVFTDEQRRESLARLARLLTEVDRMHGTRSELIESVHVPPVRNDPAITAVVLDAAAATGARVVPVPPVTASDDISELLGRVPGCYFLVGAAHADGPVRQHHSSRFDIDERCLPVAADALTAATYAVMRQAVPR
jgi:amidohydrolase